MDSRLTNGKPSKIKLQSQTPGTPRVTTPGTSGAYTPRQTTSSARAKVPDQRLIEDLTHVVRMSQSDWVDLDKLVLKADQNYSGKKISSENQIYKDMKPLLEKLGYSSITTDINVRRVDPKKNGGVESIILLPNGHQVFKATFPEIRYIHVPRELAETLGLDLREASERNAAVFQGLVTSLKSLGSAFFEQLQENQEERAKLQAEIVRLTHENVALRENNENLERENGELNEELIQTRAIVSMMPEVLRRLAALEHEKVIQNQKISKLEEENTKKDEALVKVQERLDKLEARQETQENTINLNTETLGTLQSQFAQQAADLEKFKKNIEEKLNIEKTEREKLIVSLENAKKEQTEKASQLNETASEALETRILAIKTQLSQHEKKIAGLESEHGKVSVQLKTLTKTQTDLSTEMVRQFTEINKRLDKHQKLLNQQAEGIEDLIRKQGEHVQAGWKLEKELGEAINKANKETINTLKAKIDTVNQSIDQTNIKLGILDAAYKENQTKVQEILDAQKKALDDFKEKVSKDLKEAKTAQKLTDDALVEKQKELETAQKDQKTELQEKLQKEIKTLTEAQTEQKGKIGSLEEKQAELINKNVAILEQSKLENETLLKELEDRLVKALNGGDSTVYQVLLGKINDVRGRVDDTNVELGTLRGDLDLFKDNVDQKLEQAEEKVDQKLEKTEVALGVLAEMFEDNTLKVTQALEEQTENLKKVADDINEELTEAKNNQDQIKDDLLEKLELLRESGEEKREVLEEQIAQLTQDQRELNSKVVGLKEQFKAVNNELVTHKTQLNEQADLIQANLDALEEYKEKNQKTLKALEKRMEKGFTKADKELRRELMLLINAIEGKIGVANEALGGLRGDLGDVRTDVGGLRTELGGLRTDLNNQKNVFEEFQGDVDQEFELRQKNFDDKFTQVKNDQDEIKGELNTLKEDHKKLSENFQQQFNKVNKELVAQQKKLNTQAAEIYQNQLKLQNSNKQNLKERKELEDRLNKNIADGNSKTREDLEEKITKVNQSIKQTNIKLDALGADYKKNKKNVEATFTAQKKQLDNFKTEVRKILKQAKEEQTKINTDLLKKHELLKTAQGEQRRILEQDIEKLKQKQTEQHAKIVRLNGDHKKLADGLEKKFDEFSATLTEHKDKLTQQALSIQENRTNLEASKKQNLVTRKNLESQLKIVSKNNKAEREKLTDKINAVDTKINQTNASLKELRADTLKNNLEFRDNLEEQKKQQEEFQKKITTDLAQAKQDQILINNELIEKQKLLDTVQIEQKEQRKILTDEITVLKEQQTQNTENINSLQLKEGSTIERLNSYQNEIEKMKKQHENEEANLDEEFNDVNMLAIKEEEIAERLKKVVEIHMKVIYSKTSGNYDKPSVKILEKSAHILMFNLKRDLETLKNQRRHLLETSSENSKILGKKSPDSVTESNQNVQRLQKY